MRSILDLPSGSYAGVGSREMPLEVLILIEQLAALLAEHGWTLRTGGAQGADTAFERGALSKNGDVEVFLPWAAFNDRDARTVERCRVFPRPSKDALILASEVHPAWERCGQGARLLHARNCHQVLGRKLDDPVSFVLCWTSGGRGEGGTGQAIRLARRYEIPVYDLGREDLFAVFSSYLTRALGSTPKP